LNVTLKLIFGIISVSMFSLDICKEYLNTATFKLTFLLRIKCWTFWYIERGPTSSCTGVTNF